MKYLNLLAYILVFIGALNWGLVGIFDINLVTLLFGDDTIITRSVYALVGVSALVSIFMILPMIMKDENYNI